jgi:hypothetical protein
MKFLASLLGLAPAASVATLPEPPPAMVAPADHVSPMTQIAPETPERITLEALAAHPACEVLDQMVHAFQAGLVQHGCERAAMADALMALRWADIRTPDFVGPGKRRASAKAERRFRAVLDAVIVNGAGEPAGWRDPDGHAFG